MALWLFGCLEFTNNQSRHHASIQNTTRSRSNRSKVKKVSPESFMGHACSMAKTLFFSIRANNEHRDSILQYETVAQHYITKIDQPSKSSNPSREKVGSIIETDS